MSYQPQRPPLSATFGEAVAFASPAKLAPDDLEALAKRMPRGTGAVLMLPTILSGDPQTAILRDFLASLGYDGFGWNLGLNVGPTTALLRGVEARLEELADLHGPVALIGFSMGGLFARWLAMEHPRQVRQVITGCSPFREGPKSAFLPIDGLLRVFPGPDLYALAVEIAKPLSVPGTFIYSRKDGIVAWESCLDPALPDDNAEVGCPHVTMVRNLELFEIVARRLADPMCGLWNRASPSPAAGEVGDPG